MVVDAFRTIYGQALALVDGSRSIPRCIANGNPRLRIHEWRAVSGVHAFCWSEIASVATYSCAKEAVKAKVAAAVVQEKVVTQEHIAPR